jgi:N-acetylmuramoyl-L-alanine amidase
MAFRVERACSAAASPAHDALTRARARGPGAAPTASRSASTCKRASTWPTQSARRFVWLHSNGSPGGERGLEVYYDSRRPHAAANLRMAQLLHDGVLNELATASYSVLARGAKDDSCLRLFQGRCFPLFLLGPERITDRAEILRRGGNPDALLAPGQTEIRSRATQMPAALVELLFISNAEDAALLRTEAARDAMARGIARGIARYLGRE